MFSHERMIYESHPDPDRVYYSNEFVAVKNRHKKELPVSSLSQGTIELHFLPVFQCL